MKQTVTDIVAGLRDADWDTFSALEKSLASDPRKGVQKALKSARRRLAAQAAESARLSALYEFDAGFGPAELIVGLDEVGRGPLAGPLTVGAVILSHEQRLVGLNDSKQLTARRRQELSSAIKESALAWAVASIPPEYIDEHGITRSLIEAFSQALASIEMGGIKPQVVLLDGNPLGFDPRVRAIVKGDAQSASIAAASIIAKVERDALMDAYAQIYPAYGFDRCKGYGSAEHRDAIRRHGLTPIHRVSFCGNILHELPSD